MEMMQSNRNRAHSQTRLGLKVPYLNRTAPEEDIVDAGVSTLNLEREFSVQIVTAGD